MKKSSRSTICNLIFIGTCLPWGCLGDEEVTVRRNVRRRTRYITEPQVEGSQRKIQLTPWILGGEGFLTSRGEDFFTSRTSFSMPDRPTKAPARPPAREDRSVLIQDKCGITAIERSRDILTELLTVSEASALTNPETSQYKARDWIDNIDKAIICSDNKKRIDQRYRLALLYYELGGSTWTRCKAAEDVTSSTKEEECPGKRFLDVSDECEWFGMTCGGSYNVATAEWMDAYYPLEVLNLRNNNLKGELYKEFYEFPKLKRILLNKNALSGTISEEIGEMKDVTVLQLNSNSFGGPLPEEGLLKLKQLEGLSIQGNDLRGSLNGLCDVRDDRRVEFESYLRSKMEADCLGETPKVGCDCCTKCA